MMLSRLDRSSDMRLLHTSSVKLCVVSSFKHEKFLEKQDFLLHFKGPENMTRNFINLHDGRMNLNLY
jgi:hypothetical protein